LRLASSKRAKAQSTDRYSRRPSAPIDEFSRIETPH